MEVTITPKKETSQVELTVTAPFSEFSEFVERAIGTLSKDVQVKGFRAGKAPRNLILEHVGQDRVLHEALDLALPHFFARAVIDNNIEIVHRPSISIREVGMDTPFSFMATVEVVPEITLGNPKALKVEKRPIEVTDEQVEKEIARIARMRSALTDVNRSAKEGDVATIDFRVTIDGVAIEGGESKNHPVSIGEGRFVPGFEDGLVGMNIGEEKTFPITFPEDYSKKELAGKQALATATLHKLQERKTATIDDAFAKSLGAFESLDDLKKKLRENMQEEFTAKEKERYAAELADTFMESSTFGAIPASLIEHEIDRRMEEFSSMLGYQQKTLEEYITEKNTSLADMRNNMRESALKHVKTGLALRQLAKEHDVQVSEKEIQEEANHQLSHFKSVQHAQQEIDPQELRDYVSSTLKNKKTLELLVTLANPK